MALFTEYSLLGIPFFSKKLKAHGQEVDLSQPLNPELLESYSDGTYLLNRLVLEEPWRVVRSKTVKDPTKPNTQILGSSTNHIETFCEEEINAENFMYARSVLDKIVGYQKRIVYRSPAN